MRQIFNRPKQLTELAKFLFLILLIISSFSCLAADAEDAEDAEDIEFIIEGSDSSFTLAGNYGEIIKEKCSAIRGAFDDIESDDEDGEPVYLPKALGVSENDLNEVGRYLNSWYEMEGGERKRSLPEESTEHFPTALLSLNCKPANKIFKSWLDWKDEQEKFIKVHLKDKPAKLSFDIQQSKYRIKEIKTNSADVVRENSKKKWYLILRSKLKDDLELVIPSKQDQRFETFRFLLYLYRITNLPIEVPVAETFRFKHHRHRNRYSGPKYKEIKQKQVQFTVQGQNYTLEKLIKLLHDQELIDSQTENDNKELQDAVNWRLFRQLIAHKVFNEIIEND